MPFRLKSFAEKIIRSWFLTMAAETTLTGPGATVITIQDRGAARDLQVIPGVTAVESGLTLTGGQSRGRRRSRRPGSLAHPAALAAGRKRTCFRDAPASRAD